MRGLLDQSSEVLTAMKLVTLLLLATAVAAKHEIYEGWKSFYIGASTQDQIKFFWSLVEPYEVEVLSYPLISREGVALVKPERIEDFKKAMENAFITLKIHSDDVKAALDKDDENIEKQKRDSMTRNAGKSFPYDNYQELEVIYDYMKDIAERYPNTVTLESAGNSFEGRPLYYLKISTTNFEDESKPVIIIDSGIHAREWITPPTVTWAIHKLTDDLTDPDLLQNYDWILFPVVNPDGYKFTFTTNRFWRKTRSTDQNVLSSMCPGVDGNRNYDFAWNTVGVSSNPCSDIYPGGSAFSEVESRAVRDIVLKYVSRTAMYLTMHSYGSMILYPWGHDGTLSSNALNLNLVAVAMAQEIDRHKLPNFPNYVVGNSALVLFYATSGAAEDWAHSVGVPLAYTYELPGLGWGNNGFHLDPQFIAQVARETWEGIAVGTRRAGAMFNRK